jgi:hypothetical protein
MFDKMNTGRITTEVASDARCPLLKTPLAAQMPLVLKSWEQVKADLPGQSFCDYPFGSQQNIYHYP